MIFLIWALGAILIIIDILFTITRYQTLERPLSTVTVDVYDIVPFHNSVHRRYRKYDLLPEPTFRNIKLGLRSMSRTSPFEKIIDVFAKVLFTVSLAVLTFVVSITIALASIFENDELKENKTQWFEQIKGFIASFQSYTDGYLALLHVAGVITVVATCHFVLVHIRNGYLSEHLAIINEIEQERLYASHPFAIQYPAVSGQND